MERQLTGSLSRDEMLEALLDSANDNIKRVCRLIINKEIDVNQYERQCGGFMKAVLAGDFLTAMSKADRQNFRCLKFACESKVKEFLDKYQE